MLPSYSDITSRIPDKPLWYTMGGVPRYVPFEPRVRSLPYCREVALLEIACQGCATRFTVELAWDDQPGIASGRRDRALSKNPDLFHYGDPPNVGCCPPGHTMNCIDLRVLQFWRSEGGSWVRIPELEMELEKLEDYFDINGGFLGGGRDE